MSHHGLTDQEQAKVLEYIAFLDYQRSHPLQSRR